MTNFVSRWWCALRRHPVKCSMTWQSNKFQRWECACRARQYTVVVHLVHEACPINRCPGTPHRYVDCPDPNHMCGHPSFHYQGGQVGPFHWEGPIEPGKTLQGFVYDPNTRALHPTYGDTRGTFAEETNRVAAVNRTDLGLPSPQEDR